MNKVSHIILGAVPAFIFTAGTTFAADNGHHSPIGDGETDPYISVENALDLAHDTHGAHESAAGLPQMDPTWFASQLFWLTVIFVFLYFVFSRSVLPALSSTIEGRRDQVESDLDSARELKEKAEQIHKEYEKAIFEARHKATESYLEVEEGIKNNNEARLAELAKTTTETIKDTDAQLQKSKEKALDDVDGITADMVVMAVEKLTGVEVDTKTAKATINKLTDKTTLKKAA